MKKVTVSMVGCHSFSDDFLIHRSQWSVFARNKSDCQRQCRGITRLFEVADQNDIFCDGAA